MYKFSKIFIALFIAGLSSFAQNSVVPNGWHLMDKATSGYYGVSADKAYAFLKSKNLQSKLLLWQ